MSVVWINPEIMIPSCKNHWDESYTIILSSFVWNLNEKVVPCVITSVHIIVICDVSAYHDEINGIVVKNVGILLFAFRGWSKVPAIQNYDFWNFRVRDFENEGFIASRKSEDIV